MINLHQESLRGVWLQDDHQLITGLEVVCEVFKSLRILIVLRLFLLTHVVVVVVGVLLFVVAEVELVLVCVVCRGVWLVGTLTPLSRFPRLLLLVSLILRRPRWQLTIRLVIVFDVASVLIFLLLLPGCLCCCNLVS